MIKFFMILGLLVGTITTAQAETFVADPARTVTFNQSIDGSVIHQANKILKMTKSSKSPIYVVINSGGGSVAAGVQVISTIRIAKKRGVEVHCVVPMIAASMAFQIFAECSHRYAFAYSLLLWHPIRIHIQNMALTPRDARRLAKDMEMWETDLVKVLLDKLQMPAGEFYYHYYNETLHMGVSLNKMAPGFMTLVEDIVGVDAPFTMRR